MTVHQHSIYFSNVILSLLVASLLLIYSDTHAQAPPDTWKGVAQQKLNGEAKDAAINTLETTYPNQSTAFQQDKPYIDQEKQQLQNQTSTITPKNLLDATAIKSGIETNQTDRVAAQEAIYQQDQIIIQSVQGEVASNKASFTSNQWKTQLKDTVPIWKWSGDPTGKEVAENLRDLLTPGRQNKEDRIAIEQEAAPEARADKKSSVVDEKVAIGQIRAANEEVRQTALAQRKDNQEQTTSAVKNAISTDKQDAKLKIKATIDDDINSKKSAIQVKKQELDRAEAAAKETIKQLAKAKLKEDKKQLELIIANDQQKIESIQNELLVDQQKIAARKVQLDQDKTIVKDDIRDGLEVKKAALQAINTQAEQNQYYDDFQNKAQLTSKTQQLLAEDKAIREKSYEERMANKERTKTNIQAAIANTKTADKALIKNTLSTDRVVINESIETAKADTKTTVQKMQSAVAKEKDDLESTFKTAKADFGKVVKSTISSAQGDINTFKTDRANDRQDIVDDKENAIATLKSSRAENKQNTRSLLKPEIQNLTSGVKQIIGWAHSEVETFRDRTLSTPARDAARVTAREATRVALYNDLVTDVNNNIANQKSWFNGDESVWKEDNYECLQRDWIGWCTEYGYNTASIPGDIKKQISWDQQYAKPIRKENIEGLINTAITTYVDTDIKTLENDQAPGTIQAGIQEIKSENIQGKISDAISEDKTYFSNLKSTVSSNLSANKENFKASIASDKDATVQAAKALKSNLANVMNAAKTNAEKIVASTAAQTITSIKSTKTELVDLKNNQEYEISTIKTDAQKEISTLDAQTKATLTDGRLRSTIKSDVKNLTKENLALEVKKIKELIPNWQALKQDAIERKLEIEHNAILLAAVFMQSSQNDNELTAAQLRRIESQNSSSNTIAGGAGIKNSQSSNSLSIVSKSQPSTQSSSPSANSTTNSANTSTSSNNANSSSQIAGSSSSTSGAANKNQQPSNNVNANPNSTSQATEPSESSTKNPANTSTGSANGNNSSQAISPPN